MSRKRRSDPPKYRQIRQKLLALAIEEKWERGHRFPTELELVRRYKVSRNTVRQSLADLERDGLIQRRQGQGTFFEGNGGQGNGRHFLVGAIVSSTAYIYTEIIQGAERVLSAAGYHLVMGRSTLHSPSDRTEAAARRSWNPDGFLLELWHPDHAVDMARVMGELKGSGTPFVLLNWSSEDPEVSFVTPDDVEAGAHAGSYLVANGHRRIAFVGIKGHTPSELRLKGFLRSAAQSAVAVPPDLLRWCEGADSQWRSGAHAATAEMLSLGAARPTAVFYFNDEAASQGYAAIREAGLSVPGDISVVGFDDSQISRALYPSLTTFLHPKDRIGEMAARILLDRIEDPDSSLPVRVTYTCKLIERDSVRNLAKEKHLNG